MLKRLIDDMYRLMSESVLLLRKTDSGDSSTDHEVPLEGSSSSPLAEDLEQYELMKAAYLKVGQD